MCALICGKAACKADDEGVGVDFVDDAHHSRGVSLVCKPFGLEVALDKLDELVLKCHAHVPDLLIGYVEDAFPCFGVALVGKEFLAQVLSVECLPFAGGPGGHVYAVGDISYVAFFPGIAFPDAGEHLFGYFAVQPADAVSFLTCIERKYTHGETLGGIRVFTAHIHQVVPGDAQASGEFAHIFAEEAFVEVIVACGHWSVHGI